MSVGLYMLILHSTLILILQLPQTHFFSEVCYYHRFIHHEKPQNHSVKFQKIRNKLGFDWYCVQFINWPSSDIMNSYLKNNLLFLVFLCFSEKCYGFHHIGFTSCLFLGILPYFSCYQWDYVSVVGKHADTCSYTNIYFVSSHSWNCF